MSVPVKWLVQASFPHLRHKHHLWHLSTFPAWVQPREPRSALGWDPRFWSFKSSPNETGEPQTPTGERLTVVASICLHAAVRVSWAPVCCSFPPEPGAWARGSMLPRFPHFNRNISSWLQIYKGLFIFNIFLNFWYLPTWKDGEVNGRSRMQNCGYVCIKVYLI